MQYSCCLLACVKALKQNEIEVSIEFGMGLEQTICVCG
jgi:hypothetical protein